MSYGVSPVSIRLIQLRQFLAQYDINELGTINPPVFNKVNLPDFNAILDESQETAEHYQSPESLAENAPHAPRDEMVPLPIGGKSIWTTTAATTDGTTSIGTISFEWSTTAGTTSTQN